MSSMSVLSDSPLGRAARYPDRYDPGLLFAIERAPQRDALGFGHALPFGGVDLWTAYELSWLDAAGKPQVAIANFAVPADSPRLTESKSVKLYLAGFNLTRFPSEGDVAATLAHDLSQATGAAIEVTLAAPHVNDALPHADLSGVCIDALPIAVDRFELAPEALTASGLTTSEALYTRLFRSVCPVTGQPDYACVQVEYRGAHIDHAGLLRYLVSFRRDPGFHEHCVERIFADVWRRCRPEALAVYARFTRRGGIDINPYRSSAGGRPPAHVRTARQ
jgi:7-cyano-7-deazaguanine reductase